MLELIARLRTLLDSIGTPEADDPKGKNCSLISADDEIRIRGMHDLLLAMEERVGTIRCKFGPSPSPEWGQQIDDLLERA